MAYHLPEELKTVGDSIEVDLCDPIVGIESVETLQRITINAVCLTVSCSDMTFDAALVLSWVKVFGPGCARVLSSEVIGRLGSPWEVLDGTE